MATLPPGTASTVRENDSAIHLLWINCGLSCDGESISLTAATQPSIEEIALGALPGLPKIALHWPLIDFECGPEQGSDNFLDWFHKAARGELDPFMLVIEGSIPNETISGDGYFTGFGRHPDTNQPITVNQWLDKLAPKFVPAASKCPNGNPMAYQLNGAEYTLSCTGVVFKAQPYTYDSRTRAWTG